MEKWKSVKSLFNLFDRQSCRPFVVITYKTYFNSLYSVLHLTDWLYIITAHFLLFEKKKEIMLHNNEWTISRAVTNMIL